MKKVYILLSRIKHSLQRIRDAHSGNIRQIARDSIDDVDDIVERIEEIENELSRLREKIT